MARFLTGHEVFDEIVTLEYGSSVLVVDDSLSESTHLLGALFGNPNRSMHLDVREIASRKPLFHEQSLVLSDEPLAYASASINEFRRKHKRAVLFHSYLPDFLVKYEPSEVLRFIEVAKKDIIENETLDFFLLPRGTYPEVERKLSSIVDGVVELQLKEGAHSLSAIRCSRPQYHRKNFEYRTNGEALHIKWGNEFVDHLTVKGEEEIRERMRFLLENRDYLEVVRGPNSPPSTVSIWETLLMSQFFNKPLDQILTLFQEKHEETLRKLALWHADGYIDLAKIENSKRQPVKRTLGRRTRLLLSLPSSLAAKLLSWRGLAQHFIPAEAYLARRKSDEAFYSLLFPQAAATTDVTLESIEEFLQDISTRMVTYEVIARLGEDPRNALDVKFTPKIIAMMLKSGYSVSPKIKKVSENEYEVAIANCPVCLKLRSDKPACQSLTGAIVGNTSVCVKRPLRCVETQCIATGGDRCVFVVTIGQANER